LRGRVVAQRDDAFVYDCGGVRLVQAFDGPPPRDGETVLIALRPEKIEVAAAPPDTTNRLAGILVDATYLGAEHRLTVEVDGLPEGERRLTVALPAWRSRIPLERGTRLALGWAQDASIRVAED
jgi:hypothetical protein